MNRSIWIAVVCLMTWGGKIHANNLPLILDDGGKSFNPAIHAAYIADHDNSFTISDIIVKIPGEKFIPIVNSTPNFGLNNTPVWIRFDLTSPINEDFFLSIGNPSIEQLDFYLTDTAGNVLSHQSGGSLKKMDDREVKTSSFYINLKLPDSGIYTCYLRVQSDVASMALPLQIATMQHFFQQKQYVSVWQGLFFGLILFMFVYNSFLYYSLRDATYVYFACFILSMGLMFAALKGFGIEYLWSDYPYFSFPVPVYGSLAGISVLLFTSRFLHSDTNTPKLHLWLLALISLFVVDVIAFIFGWHFLALQILIYNAVITLFFLMFVAMKVWLEGYEPAKYFLFAWSFFVASLIMFFLREAGLLPMSQFMGHILQFGSAACILFMSFALSKKINIYIETRNQAQELALHAALENERLISNQNQLLEARVAERTIDLKETVATLQKQRGDLDEANTFKDKIFSIISHDLKSPIATLAGLLQVLKLKTLSEAEKNKVVLNLEIALKATKTLLDNMLAWSVKSDRRALETEELSLRDVVDDVLGLYQYQAESKNIHLRNLIEGNFFFYANRNMIHLVLRNLVSNSIKFTPKNGMVEIGMEPNIPHLSLYIRDTGIGMSKEFIDKLFKHNVHTSTRGTENEKGTGLGLKLCKEFLEKMNGSLSVVSHPSQGTTFTVTLQNAVPELEVFTS